MRKDIERRPNLKTLAKELSKEKGIQVKSENQKDYTVIYNPSVSIKGNDLCITDLTDNSFFRIKNVVRSEVRISSDCKVSQTLVTTNRVNLKYIILTGFNQGGKK